MQSIAFGLFVFVAMTLTMYDLYNIVVQIRVILELSEVIQITLGLVMVILIRVVLALVALCVLIATVIAMKSWITDYRLRVRKSLPSRIFDGFMWPLHLVCWWSDRKPQRKS